MTEVLIEENFVHIDGSAMNVILTIFDRLDLEAEPTAPRHISESRNWVLALHWLRAGPLPEEMNVALPGAFAEVRAHFMAGGKNPPTMLTVYGLDGTVLRSIRSEG
jgi:hypothetical protein